MSQEFPFGRCLEDFNVGDVYKHWPGKTITEADDHLFCMMTMNHHPLHTNDHYAKEATQFGKNVVVGNLVYSLALGMSVRDVSGSAIANLEIENLKHPAPTFHGDTIYAETEVLEIVPSKSRDDRGIVKVRTIAYKQDGTVVCEFVRKVMIPTRASRGSDQPARPVPKTS
jgi:acyl dehydratase